MAIAFGPEQPSEPLMCVNREAAGQEIGLAFMGLAILHDFRVVLLMLLVLGQVEHFDVLPVLLRHVDRECLFFARTRVDDSHLLSAYAVRRTAEGFLLELPWAFF